MSMMIQNVQNLRDWIPTAKILHQLIGNNSKRSSKTLVFVKVSCSSGVVNRLKREVKEEEK